jgi:hypothetical protein
MPRVEDLFGARANETSRALMAISFHIGTRPHKHAGPAIREDVVHLPTVSTL